MIAHIRSDKEIQTVQEHLEHVAYMAGEYGKVIGLEHCAILTGKLHDLMKLTVEFETYIKKSFSEPEKYRQGPDHSTAGGVYITHLAIAMAKELGNAMPILAGQLISIACLYHHGGLGDMIDESAESPYLKRLNKYSEDMAWKEKYEEAVGNFEEIYNKDETKELLKEAVQEVEYLMQKLKEQGFANNKKFLCGMVAKFLYSCLIDADRYDTATFMEGDSMLLPQNPSILWEELAKIINKKMNQFPKDSLLNELRGKISENCYKNAKVTNGIYQLDCPTGSGKNFAAMRFAINTAKIHNKSRIFYVAPFISIIEQNAEEVRKLLFDDGENDFVSQIILELHSAKEISDANKFKERQKKVSDENLRRSELLAEQMDAPIVFITLARFLNTFFSSGTKNIRALHNLANAVLIVDEIQTVPIKAVALLNDTLNFLSTVCNCTIILSTATQPILNHMPDGIPAIKKIGLELSECTDEMRRIFKRTEFVDITQEGGNSKEYVAEIVWKTIQVEENALIILNTIRSVHILYEEIKRKYKEEIKKDNVIIYVLTTNLCAAHRKETIQRIKSELNNKKLIVISTQLIEAGVDISFRSVFRAVAGLDRLIQSAGRCNRHGEFQLKQVFIINPEFESLRNLRDIQRAKEKMESVLTKYKRNPQNYDYDLSSKSAIQYYYKIYYERQSEQMNYPFTTKSNRNLEMYPILNKNKQLEREYRSNKGGKDQRLLLTQSFRTAALNFKVVEEFGQPILVPYGEGKKVISELLSEKFAHISFDDKKKILRKVQLYVVNISMQKFTTISHNGGLVFYEQFGLYVLREGYYNLTYGVSEEVVLDAKEYIH